MTNYILIMLLLPRVKSEGVSRICKDTAVTDEDTTVSDSTCADEQSQIQIGVSYASVICSDWVCQRRCSRIWCA